MTTTTAPIGSRAWWAETCAETQRKRAETIDSSRHNTCNTCITDEYPEQPCNCLCPVCSEAQRDTAPNEKLARQIVSGLPSAPVREGERWVVGLAMSGETWHTGRPYGTDAAAFGRATREQNREGCNAYVVKLTSAGFIVYLAADTVLSVVPPGADWRRKANRP